MTELPAHKKPLHTLFRSVSFCSELDPLMETLRQKWWRLRPDAEHKLSVDIAIRITHLNGNRQQVHQKICQYSGGVS